MKLGNQQKAYLFACLAILAWSSVSTAFKLSLKNLTPMGLLCFSSLTATLLLGTLQVFTNPKPISIKTVIHNLKLSLPAGLLNPLIYYLILFEAYSRLRAQEAQALNYTWAVVLAVFSIILLKQKFRVIDILTLLLSFFGVVVISTRGNLASLHFDDAWASFLAVFSSVVWALYWIINLWDKRPTLTKLYYNFLVGSVFICLFALFARFPLFSLHANIASGILSACYVGVFEMGLTFLLWLKALEYTSNTSTISNLIFLTPFGSLLFIATILHESIHPATLIGLVIIIVSNLIQKSVHSYLQRNA